jgi:plasmid stabilization system protein ParE
VSSYGVRFTKQAESDLDRLFDFLLEAADLDTAERALSAISAATNLLSFSPFSCRKLVSHLPRHRELVIPFGSAGYVALFEINDAKTVTILAVRHQREADIW